MREPRSDIVLRPSRLWVGVWIATATANVALGAYVSVRALRDPVWATAHDAWGGVAVFVVIVLLGQLALEASSVRATLSPTHLVVRPGLWLPTRTREIPLHEVTRVRAYTFPNLRVILDLEEGKSVRIATSMTEVVGDLPPVEFEEGNHAGPVVLMRQIARAVELRVQNPATRGTP